MVDIFYCAGFDIKGAIALRYTTIFAHNVDNPATFWLLYEMLKLSLRKVGIFFFHMNPYILLIEVTSKQSRCESNVLQKENVN